MLLVISNVFLIDVVWLCGFRPQVLWWKRTDEHKARDPVHMKFFILGETKLEAKRKS